MSDQKNTPDFPNLAECKIRELYNINRGININRSITLPVSSHSEKHNRLKSSSFKPAVYAVHKEELIRDLSRIQMLITKSPKIQNSSLKNSLQDPIASLKGNNILTFPSSNSPFLDAPT